MRTVGISLLILVLALALQAERQPMSRYQSVIDRQMFGALPADFDPEKMPSEVAKSSSKGEAELTKEQEQVKSSIRFTSINITPTGETAVGFTDNSDPKVPRHYYLKVGEKRNDWELKEADAVKATMTIAKGDVTVSLALGGDSSKTSGATAKSSSVAAPAVAPKQPGRRSLGLPGGSLMERLRNKKSRMAEGIYREFQEADAERERKRAEERARREEEQAQERENIQNQLQAVKEELQQQREKEKAEKENAEEASTQAAEE